VAATLWLDVEDLFEYVRSHRRPSGIQRLAFEICRALQVEYNGTGLVRFVRHDPLRNGFRVVSWSEVAALFQGLTEAEPPAQTALAAGIVPSSMVRQAARKLLYRMPASARTDAIDVLLTQARSWRALGRLLSGLSAGAARSLMRRWRRVGFGAAAGTTASTDVSPDIGFAEQAAPGDVLLVLGAPWSHPNYASLVRAQRDQRGLRFALLVYDLIPLRRPEWFDHGLVRLFRAWYDDILPLCDHIFAISRATAADVEALARERGLMLAGPAVPIPVGTGFGDVPAPQRTGRLPPDGSYALAVSTIEARKNHVLLFRVWRRLLEELPREQVPTLVFAGRIGWLVDDLMRQIANTDYLDGKLAVIENPSDGELAALYQGCRFTLFPSFYEGWGLPVTESMAFGKPCLIADRTSLPEAGGTLARRFDPDNLNDAYAKIRRVIEDPADLAQWEARVRREFRPVPWSASAAALLVGLGQAGAATEQKIALTDA
jgi:glycosyltransferase involved in cell wall biosynthesis